MLPSDVRRVLRVHHAVVVCGRAWRGPAGGRSRSVRVGRSDHDGARRRQPAQLDGEDHDQDEAEPEARHAVQGEAADRDQRVVGLALGFFGVINFGDYSVGLSSGVRVIGSVGISGCLLCAIGFGWSEYQDYLKKGEENV